MQKFHFLKRCIPLLVFGALLPTTWCGASDSFFVDGYTNINIKGSKVQDDPRTNSILAYIDGHSLTVTFTENLGTVQVDVTTATGDRVEYTPIWTPDSFTTYLASTGSYVVTITLPNGDEYYGEFEVTD